MYIYIYIYISGMCNNPPRCCLQQSSSPLLVWRTRSLCGLASAAPVTAKVLSLRVLRFRVLLFFNRVGSVLYG